MIRAEGIYFILRSICICFITVCTIASCDYDVDEEFFIITRSSYFLVESATSNEKSILQIQDSLVTPNWDRRLGISRNQLGDLAGVNDQFWVSDISANRLLAIDPETEAIEDIIELGELVPHYMSVGSTHILISDTLHNRLGFLNMRNSELTLRAASAMPLQSTYRSQKFYVLMAPNQIGVWSERAFALIDVLSLQHQINDIQVDNQKFVVVYSGDSLLFESKIDVNTDAFTQIETPTNFQKVRLSPFSTANFEKELLTPVALTANHRIATLSIDQVRDFEVDFFEGELYILQKDTLNRYNAATGSSRFLSTFQGKFIRSYFYQDFIGK